MSDIHDEHGQPMPTPNDRPYIVDLVLAEVPDCAVRADLLARAEDGWGPLEWWSADLVPLLTADIKRATGGWHITHAIEVERR
jgi:hypothetical protein